MVCIGLFNSKNAIDILKAGVWEDGISEIGDRSDLNPMRMKKERREKERL